jgi:hypothetical protein
VQGDVGEGGGLAVLFQEGLVAAAQDKQSAGGTLWARSFLFFDDGCWRPAYLWAGG